LWAVEEFLKATTSIKATNKIIIDMSETVLCNTNDGGYIDIRDSNGNCNLDDKLRLEAAIIKAVLVLSLKEVLLFPSSISVEVRASILLEQLSVTQRYQRKQYGIGENFPSVVFTF
jgi:hypothetical protein